MTGVQTCALPIYHAQERRGRSMEGESKRSWRKGFDKARTAFACVLTDVLFGRRFHVVIPIEMPLVPKLGTYTRKLSRIDSRSAERREGKEWVRTCRYRGSAFNEKQNNNIQ